MIGVIDETDEIITTQTWQQAWMTAPEWFYYLGLETVQYANLKEVRPGLRLPRVRGIRG